MKNGAEPIGPKIPTTVEELIEEAKLLAGAMYKLMQNIPYCYLDITASNRFGESLYIDVAYKDKDGYIVDIARHHFGEYDKPGEWNDIYEPRRSYEGQENNEEDAH